MKLPELVYRKYKRLEELSGSRDTFNAIEMAVILRSLLITDGNGLISQLLREHPEYRPRSKKSRITFRIAKSQLIGDYGWVMEGIVPDPTFPIKQNVANVTRDAFLKTGVVKSQNIIFSVHDVIDFLANKEGGVHRDRNSTNEILIQLQDEFRVGGTEGVAATMCGISQVVTDGLKPIINLMEANNKYG
ncbi:hypothetical protein KBB76_00205 [Candidatus Saccharibacteria bacterium]|nr:hypothetical protein [Candidatus Saccharibacteria bacterium]HPW47996.1 hypothetical protein [Candidatus Saccharibacteria bacterium]